VLAERHAVQRSAEDAGFGPFEPQHGEITAAATVGGHPAAFDDGSRAGHRLGQADEVDAERRTWAPGGFDDVRAREDVVLVENRARTARSNPIRRTLRRDRRASGADLPTQR
jgi:hypothetical protein